MSKKKINECVSFWVSFVDSPSVEVNVVDWNDHQQRQFIIKDNATFGEWDWDALANEWDVEELSEWGVGVWKDPIEYADDELNEETYQEPTEVKYRCPHCKEVINKHELAKI